MPSATLAEPAPPLQNSCRHRPECSIRLAHGLPPLPATRAQPVERQHSEHPSVWRVLFSSARLGEASEKHVRGVTRARSGASPGPARVRASGFATRVGAPPAPDPPVLLLDSLSLRPSLVPALADMLGRRPCRPLNWTSGRSRRRRCRRRPLLGP